MARRLVLPAVFILLSLWFASAARAEVPDTCRDAAIDLASCKEAARHFHSVVLAIPGWNGLCSSTFGAGEANILHLMQDRRFFDVDCFDYDSHTHTIEQSRARLRAHLLNLHRLGYRELTIVTHSTGGLIATDLMLDEAIDPASGSLRGSDARSFLFRRTQEGLKLRAIHAWAVPLNGTRTAVNWAGRVLETTGFSRSVLPDLRPGSSYLADLKRRLQLFDGALSNAAPIDRADHAMSYFVLQGQSDDGVVRGIADAEPWLPRSRDLNFRLVRTQTGHSHNVAAGGELLEPTFPTVTEADRALIELQLRPRFDPFFTPQVPITALLDRQQRTVVRGIVDYTWYPQFFTAARPVVSEMIRRMLTVGYPRQPEFDTFAVKEMGDLVETKISSDDRQAVELADLLLDEILDGYGPVPDGTPTSFGGGSASARRALVERLNRVFSFVTEAVRGRPELERDLRSSGTLEEFQRRYGELYARFTDDPDTVVRQQVLSGMVQYAREASPTAISSSGFVVTVGGFAAANYSRFDESAKQDLGEAVVALSNRSPEVNQSILGQFNNSVSWLGNADTPLWAAILSDEQVTRVGTQVVLDEGFDAQQVEFATGVIERGGSTGTRPDVSVTVGRTLIEGEGVFATGSSERLQRIRDAAQRARYPVVQRALADDLRRAEGLIER